MGQSVLFELEHNQRRLEYFRALKEKSGRKNASLEKWIEIYASRVKKLEKMSRKLGLDPFQPARIPANTPVATAAPMVH